MSTQNVQPSTNSIAVDRMGSQVIQLPSVNWQNASIDLSGSTVHLWIAVPTANNPIPFTPTQFNPTFGYTFLLGTVQFEIQEADLNAWQLNPGSYAGEILVSNDGGITTDVLWRGTLIVNSGWLTN